MDSFSAFGSVVVDLGLGVVGYIVRTGRVLVVMAPWNQSTEVRLSDLVYPDLREAFWGLLLSFLFCHILVLEVNDDRRRCQPYGGT
jgi:hypothetical protein